jgi:MptA/FolE2 family GTP cyclohydrolase
MSKDTPKYMATDVQEMTEGFKQLYIDKVGVRGIKCPLAVQRKDGTVFNTIATMSSYIDLSKDKKGINMSRNARTIFNILPHSVTDINDLSGVVTNLVEAHGADNLNLRLKFEYMFEMPSPVTKIKGYEPCNVEVSVKYNKGTVRSFLAVESVESSCCPCSKNMSMLVNNITDEEEAVINTLDKTLRDKVVAAGYGAHNQRSVINMKVELNRDSKDTMWIEDMVDIAKKSASSPTHNILKREDEKEVTENQYFNAKFVEDIVRDCASQLFDELDERILDFVVCINNQESIHTTLDATSVLSAGRELH